MILASLVRLIHILFIVCMIYVPLFGNVNSLILAEAMYIGLFVHWALNNDACALTVLEQYLTGAPKSASFFQSIVGPIYQISSREVWFVSGILFSIGLYRLIQQPHAVKAAFGLV